MLTSPESPPDSPVPLLPAPPLHRRPRLRIPEPPPPSGGAGGTPEPVTVPALLEAWQLLSAHLESLRSSAEPVVDQPARRVRPARPLYSAGAPVVAQPAPRFRPELRRGKLYFTCPACRHPAALPGAFAGKLARCPRCTSAICAPDPARRIPAENRERTVSALLHPERFLECRDAHRRLPWLCVRPPTLSRIVVAAGVAFFCVFLGLAGHAVRQTRHHSPPAPQTTPDPLPGIPLGADELACALVADFLKAPDLPAKARFVSEPDATLPRMQDWYARKPGAGAAGWIAMDRLGTGFAGSARLTVATSTVRVHLATGGSVDFQVDHTPAGPRIAWEASVGYSARDWQDLLTTPGCEPTRMRVLATVDDYFNYGYHESRGWVCLRLHDPLTQEQLGYGYLPRTALPQTSPLRGALAAGRLHPLTLDLQPGPDSARTRQVGIVDIAAPDWRAAPALFASTAPPDPASGS